MTRRTVLFGHLDPFWDANVEHPSTGFWRPSISAATFPDLPVARIELMVFNTVSRELAAEVTAAIHAASPETEVVLHWHEFADLWDFEEVYAYLHDLVADYPFDPDAEDYLIHMSTGTHVVRICMFLLAESRLLPGRMLQTYPPNAYPKKGGQPGYRIIDLDLSRYDQLARRVAERRTRGTSYLKSGIETRNAAFNRMIEEIEQIAIASTQPILLTGPTGAGKSLLAQRIYELKQLRHQIKGAFVPVNCATLKGENAMSALFGHRKGAFTGALSERTGLLRRANGGLLFLDEIGELGEEEQAMLLRALETGRFYPMGADVEEESRFQLIAGTNRDLAVEVRRGGFREDLLARINLWTYRLPGLAERGEDIEPNLDYELDKFGQSSGKQASFNREARHAYLRFAISREAAWRGNFRDLNASVTRMATLAAGGRITPDLVEREVERLRTQWAPHEREESAEDVLAEVFDAERLDAIDLFDRVQLARVVQVCRQSRTIAEAGRTLFQASRERRASTNDSDRVRKYLARFGLDWRRVSGS